MEYYIWKSMYKQRGNGQEAIRQVWQHSNEVSDRKSQLEILGIVDNSRVDDNTPSSERRSLGDDRQNDGTEIGERDSKKTNGYIRDIQTQGNAYERSRESSTERNSLQIKIEEIEQLNIDFEGVEQTVPFIMPKNNLSSNVVEKVISLAANKINFKLEETVIDEKAVGIKTKYNRNIEAIKLFKQIESENRLATSSEQKILSQYSG